MSTIHNPALNYRPEIDGLRTMAVVPVILFHAGFQLFSGGFIGVDVFFVISGYLITSIILAEMLAGKFSLVNFYERRARRILPSLFVVMLTCLPMAWVWLDPLNFKFFAKSLIAVPTFSSNVLFWRESGYFDVTSELKPLLHTWTLAVEEQYYLVFPLILMAAWGLGRKRIVAILMIGAMMSLVISEHGATHESSASFYLLHARAWELLVGSFIAFYFSWRPRLENGPKAINQAATMLGTSLILYAIFTFDSTTSFPGLHALIPTIGAALIIIFANAHTLVGRVLSTRAFVLIGMISYSAYLWHQPIFAFARESYLVEPSSTIMLALTLLSLVLAYLSWRFIEQAFRKKSSIKRHHIFTLGAIFSLMFIGVGLTGYTNEGFASRFDLDPVALESFTFTKIRFPCDKNYDGNGWSIDFCLFGAVDKNATPEVAVFGDSHAEVLLPAFDTAGKERGKTIVHIGLAGCPPLLGVDVLAGNYVVGVCEALARREYDYVKMNGIKTVILVSRWTLYTDGDYDKWKKSSYFLVSQDTQEKTKEASRAVFEKALNKTVEAYQALGTHLYIVAQVPQQMVDPKNLYYQLARGTGSSDENILQRVSELSVPLSKHNQLQQFTRHLFELDSEQNKIRLVTLDNIFCQQQVCLIGDTHSYYMDYNHLNAKGSQLAVNAISNVLAQ
ncbi:acyltransferase family protein [Pseudomonas sp. MH9.2]|uniref:acyltransferase family protein n=2 Tax=Pseudomonas TaxID=286 RepID=UPI002B23E1A1|nr:MULTISPECIES: acyltransferase family protein [unclassified Pseudomonas]MEB0006465.1 acyltransferase family protein [Pseudomonas sp. RTB2]MEB0018066.1 acyltransferase family protein [Pseudomonas sp. RTB3]MEB0028726.1 acyltransferase family protein [Pseudomonas sp. MH9.2]MEB0149157.1 acyltransferase family protein [Pseudomonas sp. CCC2.2]MEB0270971.1 acyltransferase family protein [Pseudomonas sp. 5B4]